MNKLNQDLASLTGLSVLSLDKLSEKAATSIAHCVYESVFKKEPLTCIDIGYGQLYIKQEENSLKYKFIPSVILESKIKFAILNKESPLVLQAEESLRQRIEQSYKELL